MTEFIGTPRDWLREQGFQVGDRGRLSKAMQIAIEQSGLTFIEPEKEKVVDNSWKNDPYWQQSLQRPSKTLYGLTKEGFKIGFVMCFQCKQHMTYCECVGGVVAPSSVVKVLDKEAQVR